MKFANLKIGTRLAAGLALINLLLVTCVVVSIVMLARLDAGTSKLVQDAVPKTLTASAAMDDINDIAISLRNLMLVEADADRERQYASIATARSAMATKLDYLKEHVRSENGKAVLQQVLDADAAYAAMLDKALALLRAGSIDEAKPYLLQQMRPKLLAYKDGIAALVTHQTRSMGTLARKANQDYRDSRNGLLAMGGVSLLFSIYMGVMLTRSITRPIGRALEVAETVAAGDLTSDIRIDCADETGQLLQALKRMNDSLVRIVGEVRDGTETIASASGQIAAGNLDLSARTEQQAGSLEETASSMEELTSAVRHNEDNARQANQLAVSASQVAVKGGSVVSEVVTTMDAIHASSKKIVDIIAVIDGIAFQTNILALNAAVEAARAGEQGRGFAVVASEVRNLAQRSATAAKEIKQLIDDSVSKVEDGSRLVNQAGQTMDEVVGSIQRVTDIMGEISMASAEQSSGISQVNEAITQMDDVTQQNAALVEEAAAAANSLQEQSQRLAQSVSVFKLHAQPRATVSKLVSKTRIAAAPAASAAPAKAPRLVANGDWEEF